MKMAPGSGTSFQFIMPFPSFCTALLCTLSLKRTERGGDLETNNGGMMSNLRLVSGQQASAAKRLTAPFFAYRSSSGKSRIECIGLSK